MNEWARQRAHVNKLLDLIAEMPAGPGDEIRWRDVTWTRDELMRLLHLSLYERAWCEAHEQKGRQRP